MGVTWLLQLLAALLSLQVARLWWSLGLTEHHWARYHLAKTIAQASDPASLRIIPSDLAVRPLVGFLTEAMGTFVECYLTTLVRCVIRGYNRQVTRCANHWVAPLEAVKHGDDDDGNAIVTGGARDLTEPSKLQGALSYAVRFGINMTLTAKGELLKIYHPGEGFHLYVL